MSAGSARPTQRVGPTNNELPERRRLYHDVPRWVQTDDAVFFITVCCADRGTNHLYKEGIAKALFETMGNRVERDIWHPYLVLLMPDHLHMLLHFNLRAHAMAAVMARWKDWARKRTGIVWQRGFFDHRLRGDEGWREKADYILHNPVRAGLVLRWEDWPYVWFPAGRAGALPRP
ncbi:MAG: hypothetical protein V1873_01270 [Verrucomicrobiota bacterium]